jgi:hypothetical protein
MNIASEKRNLISLVEGGVLPEFISLLKAPVHPPTHLPTYLFAEHVLFLSLSL